MSQYDPNRTQLSPPPFAGDANRTQAMSLGQVPSDPDLRQTTAMAAMPQGGLTAQVVAGREASMANGPAREQYLVEFTVGGAPMAGFAGPTTRTPMNLCLVIDRSGSMDGMPLEYVKQACVFVLDMLSPTDILSIVTFEETVEVLMPPQRVTTKEPIKAGIQRLMTGNTTNLFDGVNLGMHQVLHLADPSYVSRMVVLTDGDPTAGIKDFPSLVNLAGDVKGRGITATFLGFGPDYNEELLAAMARKAGGNYYYIPRPEMIPEIFRSELQKMMTVAVKNLRLDLKLARWVTLRSPQLASGGDVSIHLSDLERGASLQQVFDFEFPNHPLGWYRVAAGKLSYEDLATGTPRTQDLDFVMEFTADTARYSAPQDPRVASAAQIALASKAVEKTVMGLKTGAISQLAAVQELQKTQMLLTQQGRSAEAQEVTMALQAIQSGDLSGAEKTLMGTALTLDQGKKTQ